MSFPNKNPAPLGLYPQPVISSGSDHNKSQISPSWGISYILFKFYIYSIVFNLGDNPPCKQKI